MLPTSGLPVAGGLLLADQFTHTCSRSHEARRLLLPMLSTRRSARIPASACTVHAVSGTRRRNAGSRSRARPTLARIPALDGIRAIAVVAVLLFHAGVSWIPGGTLGVDVFFVLSGFLITALLVGERDRRRDASASAAFYLRRARRLLPALVLVLLFVGAHLGPGPAQAPAPDAARQTCSPRSSTSPTGASPSQARATSRRSTRRRRCCTPGRWPWRSSSTCSGRSSCHPAAAPRTQRRRAGRLALVALAFAATLLESLAGVWTDRLYYGTDTRAMRCCSAPRSVPGTCAATLPRR